MHDRVAWRIYILYQQCLASGQWELVEWYANALDLCNEMELL